MPQQKKAFTIEVNGAEKAVSTVGDLRQQVEELEKEFEKTEFGTERFKQLESELQRANSSLVNMEEQVEGLSLDDKMGAIGDAAGGAGQALAGLEGAAALVGAEGEELEKTLLKVQQALALAEGAEGVGKMIGSLGKLKQVIRSVGISMRALTTAGVIGAVITAAGLLVSNWGKIKSLFSSTSKTTFKLKNKMSSLVGEVDNTEESYNNLLGSQNEVIAKTQSEILKIKSKLDVIKSENTTQKEREDIYNRLVKQYPDYLEKLEKEELSVSRITEELKGLVEQLRKKAVAQALEKETESIANKLVDTNVIIRQWSKRLNEAATARAKFIEENQLPDATGEFRKELEKDIQILKALGKISPEQLLQLEEGKSQIIAGQYIADLEQLQELANETNISLTGTFERLNQQIQQSDLPETVKEKFAETVRQPEQFLKLFQKVRKQYQDEFDSLTKSAQKLQSELRDSSTVAEDGGGDKDGGDGGGDKSAAESAKDKQDALEKAIEKTNEALEKQKNIALNQPETEAGRTAVFKIPSLRNQKEILERIKRGMNSGNAFLAQQAFIAYKNGNFQRARNLLGLKSLEPVDQKGLDTESANNIKAQTDAIAAIQSQAIDQATQAASESDAEGEGKGKKPMFKNVEDAVNQLSPKVNELTGSVTELFNTFTQNQIESLNKRLEAIREKKGTIEDDLNETRSNIDNLTKKLGDVRVSQRKKVINAIREEKNEEQKLAAEKRRIAKQEEKAEKKKAQLKRKQFRREKISSLAQSAINTAQGITKALAQTGTGFPAVVPIIAAIGAAQAATISAQKNPYKKGGYTGQGNPDQPAGTVHKGEYVVPKHIVDNPNYSKEIGNLEKARQKGYQQGGIVNNNTNIDVSGVESRLDATNNEIKRLRERPTFVSVQEVKNKQNKVDSVKQKSEL
jgi:hypothetical protein